MSNALPFTVYEQTNGNTRLIIATFARLDNANTFCNYLRREFGDVYFVTGNLKTSNATTTHGKTL